MGGVKTLTALLHSPDPRLVYEASTALSYIVSDSEENKGCIIADHGVNLFAQFHLYSFYISVTLMKSDKKREACLEVI